MKHTLGFLVLSLLLFSCQKREPGSLPDRLHSWECLDLVSSVGGNQYGSFEYDSLNRLLRSNCWNVAQTDKAYAYSGDTVFAVEDFPSSGYRKKIKRMMRLGVSGFVETATDSVYYTSYSTGNNYSEWFAGVEQHFYFYTADGFLMKEEVNGFSGHEWVEYHPVVVNGNLISRYFSGYTSYLDYRNDTDRRCFGRPLYGNLSRHLLNRETVVSGTDSSFYQHYYQLDTNGRVLSDSTVRTYTFDSAIRTEVTHYY
ncbi:MAG: hypothetical protein U0T74_08115 [Chitinophagales bacterium]